VASNVGLGFSGPTDAIRSCPLPHSNCQGTGPLVLLLNWPDECEDTEMAPDLLGYVASGLVLLTFTAKNMLTLRILAIFSNFAFICYGIIDSIRPVLCLHAILLPLNLTRLVQLRADPKPSRSGSVANPRTWFGRRPVNRAKSLGFADESQKEQMPGPTLRLLRLLARWRERERHRRELATMSAIDFGDIPVPPGLIREEQGRWPWQPMSRGWAALSREKYVPENGESRQRSAITDG
jgi:uncharacterized protein YjiS (DUF1127 family)